MNITICNVDTPVVEVLSLNQFCYAAISKGGLIIDVFHGENKSSLKEYLKMPFAMMLISFQEISPF